MSINDWVDGLTILFGLDKDGLENSIVDSDRDRIKYQAFFFSLEMVITGGKRNGDAELTQAVSTQGPGGNAGLAVDNFHGGAKKGLSLGISYQSGKNIGSGGSNKGRSQGGGGSRRRSGGVPFNGISDGGGTDRSGCFVGSYWRCGCWFSRSNWSCGSRCWRGSFRNFGDSGKTGNAGCKSSRGRGGGGLFNKERREKRSEGKDGRLGGSD